MSSKRDFSHFAHSPLPSAGLREMRGTRVVCLDSETPRAFTLIELLVTVAIIGILAALLVPGLGLVKRNANSVECVSNLRQHGVAVRIASDESEGRLPRAVEFTEFQTNAPGPLPSIQQVLLPHMLGTREVFKCPADKSGVFERTGSSYEWNASLNGQILHRIAERHGDDGRIFLLRDHQEWHPRGRRNAVFVDGHAGPQD